MFCSEACIGKFVSNDFVSMVFFFFVWVSPAVVALGLDFFSK